MNLKQLVLAQTIFFYVMFAELIIIDFPVILNPRHYELQRLVVDADRPDLAEYLARIVPKQYALIKSSNRLYLQEQELRERGMGLRQRATQTTERLQHGDPNALASLYLNLPYKQSHGITPAIQKMRNFAYISGFHSEDINSVALAFPDISESDVVGSIHPCLVQLTFANGLKISPMPTFPKSGDWKKQLKHMLSSAKANSAVFYVNKGTKTISLNYNLFIKKPLDEQAFILTNAAARTICGFGSRDGWMVSDKEKVALRRSRGEHRLQGGPFTNANRLEAFVRECNGYPQGQRLDYELKTTKPRQYDQK